MAFRTWASSVPEIFGNVPASSPVSSLERPGTDRAPSAAAMDRSRDSSGCDLIQVAAVAWVGGSIAPIIGKSSGVRKRWGLLGQACDQAGCGKPLRGGSSYSLDREPTFGGMESWNEKGPPRHRSPPLTAYGVGFPTLSRTSTGPRSALSIPGRILARSRPWRSRTSFAPSFFR